MLTEKNDSYTGRPLQRPAKEDTGKSKSVDIPTEMTKRCSSIPPLSLLLSSACKPLDQTHGFKYGLDTSSIGMAPLLYVSARYADSLDPTWAQEKSIHTARSDPGNIIIFRSKPSK